MKHKWSYITNKIRLFAKLIFSINNFDNHLVCYFCGLRIKKKLSPVVIKLDNTDLSLNKDLRQKRIIASLTTFPERINTVSKTIKTIFNQSLKPDEIVLYLADSQFINKENDLPKELLELKNYGLQIKWCEDLKSYKKLIPALKEYPNDIIITFDDDIYYPKDTIASLYSSYLKYPTAIHSNRIRRLFYKNEELFSKTSIENLYIKYNVPSFLNKITGCGGVLYPPNSFNEKVFDIEKFKEILPTQDDVWFWGMAVLNNTKIVEVKGYDIQLITVENTQNYGLSKMNSKKGKGMDSLTASRIFMNNFTEIKEKLKEYNIV